MSKESAGALIIRNLKLFDDSYKLFRFTIEPKVFSALEQQIKKWVEAQSTKQRRWYGAFEWEKDEEYVVWPAPGSEDTELGVLMEPEVGHGEAEVYTRVQA